MRINAGLNDCEDFSPIPVGKYNWVVKEGVETKPVLDTPTDIDGACYVFIIRPEVEGGDCAGKKARKQLTNRTKATRYFMRLFLEKIGVEIAPDGSFDPITIPGKRFSGDIYEREVVTAEGIAKKYSDISEDSIVAL